jgi:hypothetical protein
MDFESGQRLRSALSTVDLPYSEAALVALAGDPSTDGYRRAAAALRNTTAMLTKQIHGASASLRPYVFMDGSFITTSKEKP